MRRRRVLILVTTYQSVVTILASKIAALSKSPGIDIHVASSYEDPSETRDCGGVYHRISIARSIRLFADLAAVIRVVRLIRKERIDLIHTHTAKAGFIGALAGLVAGIPVVHTYHGLPFYEGQPAVTKSLYRVLELLACRMRSVLFSQNRLDYGFLKNARYISCPVVLEGNGVDAHLVKSNAAADAASVKGFFPPCGFRLLCVSRLVSVKRLRTVIDCAAHLRDVGLACNCIIAGKGPMEPELRNYIVDKGATDHIQIVYTPYIHSLISMSDLVVLTSEKEGIPRSLMEAMVLRKPIVATDVLGTNELVVHNKTGLLVPLGDQQAFNQAVLRIAGDPRLARNLGSAGFTRIQERFDETKIAHLWHSWYGRILGREAA